MDKLFSLIAPIIFTAIVLGCTEVSEKKLNDDPKKEASQVDAPVVPPEATYVQDFSEVIGNWDIVSFDNYTPTRLSRDGKNHAFVNFTKSIVTPPDLPVASRSSGHVSIRIECNYSGMPAKILRSGALENLSSYSGMIATQMGCRPEKQARDEQFFKFFDSQPKIERLSADMLRLTTEDHILLLQKRVTSQVDLSGYWQLRYVNGAMPIVTNEPRYDHLFFSFSSKGSNVRGYDGCNRIRGRIKFTESRMRIDPIETELQGCTDGLKRLLSGYEEILFVDGTYEVDGLYLIIKSEGKSYELVKLDERPQRPLLPPREPNEAPSGTKLCEVRKPKPQETFPDYPPPIQGRGGYTIRMLVNAAEVDHQDFMFGSTALSEVSTPILFEKDENVWVVQRISPYQTRLHFGDDGIYCTSEGSWKDGIK